jgi:lysine-specific permease
MITITIVIFGANIWVFQAGNFTWFDFITNYILIPVTPLLYLVYKYVKKTKIVPLMECDFTMPRETVQDDVDRPDLAK